MLDYSIEDDYFRFNYHVGLVKSEKYYYTEKKRISPYIFQYNNLKNVIEFEKEQLISSLLYNLKPYIQVEQKENINSEIELTARLVLNEVNKQDILIHNEVNKQVNLIKKQIQDNLMKYRPSCVEYYKKIKV